MPLPNYEKRLRCSSPVTCYTCGLATLALLASFMVLSPILKIGINDIIINFMGVTITFYFFVCILALISTVILVSSALKTMVYKDGNFPKLAINLGKIIKFSLLINSLTLWYILWIILASMDAKKSLNPFFF